jgi:CTP:molybdopterin cytidylyltransferase MocA
LVAWAVDAAIAAEFADVIVVTGRVLLDDIVPDNVIRVHNHIWSQGQATSLRAAWKSADYHGHDAIVVGLGDQPLIPPECWRRVGLSDASPIVTATFGGERLPPVRLTSEVWPLLPTDGDEGARRLMRERPDLVTEVPCEGQPIDIDTVEDLDRWS